VSNVKRGNMYPLSVKQWNPFVGYRHNRVYCRSSFQVQLRRWAKDNCELCYRFEPHMYPERLEQKLLETRYMQFIFTRACGDIAFRPTGHLSSSAYLSFPRRIYGLLGANLHLNLRVFITEP